MTEELRWIIGEIVGATEQSELVDALERRALRICDTIDATLANSEALGAIVLAGLRAGWVEAKVAERP